MKRTLIVGAVAAALAGCGVNKIPEVSDIRKSLEEQFAECKYVSLSDIKKLNGQDLGSGRYAVKQQYTLEILPLSGYASEFDKWQDTNAKVKQIQEALSAEFTERKERIKAEIKQLDENFSKVVQAHEASLEKAIARGASDAEIQEEKQRYLKASAQRMERWKELDDAFYNDGDFSAELTTKFVAAGLPAKIMEDLNSSYSQMHKRAVQEFDSTCNKMSSAGRVMALQVGGLSPGTQMIALAKGKKMEFSDTATYTKTENGWIRMQ